VSDYAGQHQRVPGVPPSETPPPGQIGGGKVGRVKEGLAEPTVKGRGEGGEGEAVGDENFKDVGGGGGGGGGGRGGGGGGEGRR